MKKHRLDNGDYPYENGHMNGKSPLHFFGNKNRTIESSFTHLVHLVHSVALMIAKTRMGKFSFLLYI